MEVIDPKGHDEVNTRSWVSVCPLGLYKVQQVIRRPGPEAPSFPCCPQHGSLCRVRVSGPDVDRVSSGETDGLESRRLDAVLQVPPGSWTSVRLGEGLCDVTESCLERMGSGDVSQVLLSPLGGGPDQTFEVELETFTPGRETWQLPPDEKLEWVKSHKQRGGERFRSGDVWGAADSYSRALRLLVTLQDPGQEDPTDPPPPPRTLSPEEFGTIKSELHSNMSLCQLKVDQPGRARLSAAKATLLEPDATKAWYRLGRACQLLDEPDEARRAFKEVLRLQPDSAVATKALRDIAEREKRSDEELGLRLSKMFT